MLGNSDILKVGLGISFTYFVPSLYAHANIR